MCSPFAKVGNTSQISLQREYFENTKEGGNSMAYTSNIKDLGVCHARYFLGDWTW
ncbi:hypothetical protein NBRC116187_20700 [Halopseudomonas sabulinigri]|uniref:Uncharacterized protein n=1 Tax=Halopseudomonas sabulinigri TaxID=472181 RepID=A0ABP9ZQG7_9GAMM